MPCFRPVTCWQPLDGGAISFSERKDHREIQIPCGQCIGCRINRQQMWAFRALAEASLHPSNWFLTLTYSNENLPAHGALQHRDWQLFAKRVRKSLGPFRYLMCGEYGPQTLRPHYHALLFGLELPDAKPSGLRRGHTVFKSEALHRNWGLGLIELGSVSPMSARYCAGYVLKDTRQPSRVIEDTGEIVTLPAPYGRMSLKPGLGDAWIRRYYPEVFAHGACFSQDKRYRIPDRFKHILDGIDPVAYETLQADAVGQATISPDNSPERLAVRELLATQSLARTRELRSNAL